MSKKLDFTKPELTFLKLGVELLLLKEFENTSEMFFMISLILRIYKYVINKYNDKLVQIWLADAIHEIHERYGGGDGCAPNQVSSHILGSLS
ncbi:hypothetical protein Hanom_Chr12g01118591 [Helianthus anomalus]